MTAMTDEKRVSDRLYVFAKILANNEWTAALLGAYNPDGSTEVPYEAAKAALVADLTALARRSQEPDGWRPVPVEPTEKITAYEAQVLIGTSISGCNMPPDRVFDLKAAWARLYDFGLIDRADGIACPTQAGAELIASMIAAAPIPPSNEAK